MWFFLFDYKTKLFLGFKSTDHGYLGPAGSQALRTQCRGRLSSWPQAPWLILLPFSWKDSRGPAVTNSGSVPRLLVSSSQHHRLSPVWFWMRYRTSLYLPFFTCEIQITWFPACKSLIRLKAWLHTKQLGQDQALINQAIIFIIYPGVPTVFSV